jgi:UDP-glucose:(heptosyl)LPS alpha-1,3-glucosyltransferase
VNSKHREILRLERELFNPGSNTKIIANSQMVAQEIRDCFSIPSSRIAVIPNGVPKPLYVTLEERAALRKKWGMEEQECAVLFVGSGWKRKGLETALLAIQKSNAFNSKKTMKLWVAGKGRVDRYSSASAQFLGPIKNVSELYAAADLFILPTLYDPFSNASLEALAAGLPVITSAANGCSEILDTTIHGSIIANPLDVEAFAAALSSWQTRLQEPQEEEQIRHACAARGAAFDIEKNVQATLKVIEQVLNLML